MLYRLTRRESPFDCSPEELEDDIRFANAAAALSVTKRGAIQALPLLIEVEALVESNSVTA